MSVMSLGLACGRPQALAPASGELLPVGICWISPPFARNSAIALSKSSLVNYILP